MQGDWHLRLFGFHFIVGASVLLAGCLDSSSELPALPGVQLTGPQSAALTNLTQAGSQAFNGRTWTFQFGAGCVLRVSTRFGGRHESSTDTAMLERSVEVVPYATGGFGVKAVDIRKGGSADVFASASELDAQAAAAALRGLIEPCKQDGA
jgi:hypothetical protein